MNSLNSSVLQFISWLPDCLHSLPKSIHCLSLWVVSHCLGEKKKSHFFPATLGISLTLVFLIICLNYWLRAVLMLLINQRWRDPTVYTSPPQAVSYLLNLFFCSCHQVFFFLMIKYSFHSNSNTIRVRNYSQCKITDSFFCLCKLILQKLLSNYFFSTLHSFLPMIFLKLRWCLTGNWDHEENLVTFPGLQMKLN